jgi:hypothetical protein
MSHPDYFAKFGEFIHWYASVERIIHYIFRHFSGMPEDVARTIDGGMALTALISTIKRVIVARKIAEKDKDELEALFITQLRDSLVNRGGESIGQSVISANLHVAKSQLDWEVLELKLSDIKDAAVDCVQLYMRFTRLLEPESAWTKDAEAHNLLDTPWQYKPRAPKRMNQGRGTRTLSSQRRSTPSRRK